MKVHFSEKSKLDKIVYNASNKALQFCGKKLENEGISLNYILLMKSHNNAHSNKTLGI